MNWKNYSHLRNTHAFLSPSRYHWLRYDSEKLITTYENYRKVKDGTRYHKLAEELISLSVRLPQISASLNSFVNDAIGFRMHPEVVLYYSDHCYGTADAISFYKGILRIHDLKTGVSPASLDQLYIYAGLFFLDYNIDSREVKKIVLRIYQNEEVLEAQPTVSDIEHIVERIQEADKVLEDLLGV